MVNCARRVPAAAEIPALICEDGIHPNGDGQALMEKTFVDYIVKHAAYMMA